MIKTLSSMKYLERVEYELALINAEGIEFIDIIGEEKKGIIDMQFTGPKETPYEDLVYNFQYHLHNFESMPKIHFPKDKMFHANVFPEGNVCFGNLKWNREMTIGMILNCLTHLIGNPNYSSPANEEPLNYTHSSVLMKQMVKKYYLGLKGQ